MELVGLSDISNYNFPSLYYYFNYNYLFFRICLVNSQSDKEHSEIIWSATCKTNIWSVKGCIIQRKGTPHSFYFAKMHYDKATWHTTDKSRSCNISIGAIWALIWLREHGAGNNTRNGSEERCTATQPTFPYLPVNIFMDTVY